MKILWTTLFAFLMVTAVMSKPVHLSQAGDSDSDSNEAESSEEGAANAEAAEEPELAENAVTEAPLADTQPATDLLPAAGTEPSPATIDTSVAPEPEVGQVPTDPLQVLPEDPSQTAAGTDIAQEAPQETCQKDTAAHVQPDNVAPGEPGVAGTDIFIGTGVDGSQPQVSATITTIATAATAFQESPQGATPPSTTHIKATITPLSTAPPLPITIGADMSGVPVCFTFQFKSPEPGPPRGDSM